MRYCNTSSIPILLRFLGERIRRPSLSSSLDELRGAGGSLSAAYALAMLPADGDAAIGGSCIGGGPKG